MDLIKAKMSNVMKFNGQNLLHWIRDLEWMFTTIQSSYELTDGDKIILAGQTIETSGPARNWWYRIMMQQNTPNRFRRWEELKQAAEESFLTYNEMESARDKMNALHYKGDITEFRNEMENLNIFGQLTGNVYTLLVKRKMPQRIRDRISASGLEDLNDPEAYWHLVQRCAKEIEADYRFHKNHAEPDYFEKQSKPAAAPAPTPAFRGASTRGRPWRGRGAFRGFGRGTFTPAPPPATTGTPTPNRAQTPAPTGRGAIPIRGGRGAGRGAGRGTVTCYNCGQPGHISPHCPEPRKTPASVAEVRQVSFADAPTEQQEPAEPDQPEEDTSAQMEFDDEGIYEDYPFEEEQEEGKEW